MLFKTFLKNNMKNKNSPLILFKMSICRFTNYNLSDKKKNLRDIQKIKIFHKENSAKKPTDDEHEDYIKDKDIFEVKSNII